MNIWMILGGLLLAWVAYDLYAGVVYLDRAYLRADEPWAYWLIMLLWLAVAISCFIV